MYIFDNKSKSDVGEWYPEIRSLTNLSGLGWSSTWPDQHEILTRQAATGLPLPDDELKKIIEANKAVDKFLPVSSPYAPRRTAFSPYEQKRHALRKSPLQSTADAVHDIYLHLRSLYHETLSARSKDIRFQYIGEALHLIQDSYSPAHMERTTSGDGRHLIRYVRFFDIGSKAPREHNFPTDERDSINSIEGRRWVVPAINASREWLQMIMRHLANPPRDRRELNEFLNKHFSLSSGRV